jgi:uncharacterized protein (DUF58 family)
VRLTGRGCRVLAGAVLLLAAGVWADLPLLRVLAAGAAGALLVAVLVVASAAPVTVRREVHPGEVTRGEPALARLVVTNPGRRGAAGFEAHDRIGADVQAPVPVPALGPGESVPRTYELPTARRGKLTVGPLRIRRTDPFGLASRTASAGTTRTLWVRPRTHPVRPYGRGGGRGHGVVSAATPFRGAADFRSLREYVVGDEPRHVHWKSTARTGQLMVREFTDPRRTRLVVMLDDRAGVLSPEQFEEAVEVAASLSAAARAAGHDVRLSAVGADPVDTAQRASDHDLDVWLCTVTQSGAAGNPSAALLREAAGADVVVLTGAGDLDGLAGLRRRFARLVVLDFTCGSAPGDLMVVPAESAVPALAACTAVMAG